VIPGPRPYTDELVSSALIRCCRWFDLPFKVLARKVLHAPEMRVNFLSVWPLRKLEVLFDLPAEQLLWHHTQFPYATAFLRGDSFALAKAAALDGGDGLPRLLSVMQHVSVPVRRRRTCVRCVEEDLKNTGETYWHRAHNLPGVFTCHRHGCALALTNVAACGDLKTIYALPIECETWRAPQFARAAGLQALARSSEQLLRRSPGPGTPCDAADYRALATGLGWLTRNRPVSAQALCAAINSVFPDDFMASAGLPTDRMTWPALCFRPASFANCSPLKHLLVQTTLVLGKSKPASLDHTPAGPAPSSTQMLDDYYSGRARAVLVRALARGEVLSTAQFLQRSSALGPYRHRGSTLSKLRQVVLEFRASPASVKRLRVGSTLFRVGSNRTIPVRMPLIETPE
jgi:hypothetical protein